MAHKKTRKAKRLCNRIVRLLNNLLERDPVAIGKLFDVRVSCNDVLANHPTITVLTVPAQDYAQERDINLLSIIGLLNGVCGFNREGWPYIWMDIDSFGNLLRFRVREDLNVIQD